MFQKFDNSAIIDVIFSQNISLIKEYSSTSDFTEGFGRLLQLAVQYGNDEIVQFIYPKTPPKYYIYALFICLKYQKKQYISYLLPSAVNSSEDVLFKTLNLAIEQKNYLVLETLIPLVKNKKNLIKYIDHIDKYTPMSFVLCLEKHLGKSCKKISLNYWTLAGRNPKAFAVFAQYINLPEMHKIVEKKIYTDLTKNAQTCIENLLSIKKE